MRGVCARPADAATTLCHGCSRGEVGDAGVAWRISYPDQASPAHSALIRRALALACQNLGARASAASTLDRDLKAHAIYFARPLSISTGVLAPIDEHERSCERAIALSAEETIMTIQISCSVPTLVA